MTGRVLVALAAALTLPVSIRVRAQSVPPLIDAIVRQEMQARRIPGVAVAVIENGAITFERAYGIANLETETPLATDAVFELASVTKQFTAAAVMMLVEEGKVRLDDPIGAYVDRAPPAWERITIRHLLTHTSGLDISAVPTIQGATPLKITTAQVLAYLAERPLQWPTGQVGWYSDAGYFLLGMVIEKASGQKYRDFVGRRIFQPLKMSDTTVPDKTQVLKRRVPTYTIRAGEYVKWLPVWDYELPSFFGIHSTLRDLAAWDQSLRTATLLKRETIAQMWTPAKLANGQNARVYDELYGFGFELFEVRGRPVVGHQGATGTYLLHFVDEPLTIAVLSNFEVRSGERHPKMLARSVAGALRPQYRPPHMLTPQANAEPEITRALQTLLADVGARRPSAVMSTAYRAWYSSDPGAQAWYARNLGGASSLMFLGSDDLGGRTLWGGEPLASLVHYTANVKGATTYITVGINRDGQIATLSFYARAIP